MDENVEQRNGWCMESNRGQAGASDVHVRRARTEVIRARGARPEAAAGQRLLGGYQGFGELVSSAPGQGQRQHQHQQNKYGRHGESNELLSPAKHGRVRAYV